MDTLALEATQPKRGSNATMGTGLPGSVPTKRKQTKKAKKAVVFFEVEILDAKTKDKLCFLDKVRASFCCLFPLKRSMINQFCWINSDPATRQLSVQQQQQRHMLPQLNITQLLLGLCAIYSLLTWVLRNVWCFASYAAVLLWTPQEPGASTHCQG